METIRLGGDSDTNSAVVGGLLGAAVGLEELPSKLKKKVLKCDSAADDLRYRDRKRPEFLSVQRNFKMLMKGVLKNRARGKDVKIYEIKTNRKFVDPNEEPPKKKKKKQVADEKDAEEPAKKKYAPIRVQHEEDKPAVDAFMLIDTRGQYSDESEYAGNHKITHDDLKTCMQMLGMCATDDVVSRMLKYAAKEG